MTWNDFVYGLGAFFEATFEILAPLGNLPNVLFTIALFAGFFYWLRQLSVFKSEAKQSGGIE